MGTTILESKGTWMEGMDRHTYWILPLHILAQAGWYKLFGFSLLSLRSLSIFWGAILLFSLYAIVNRLSRDPAIALLSAGLLAIDHAFIGVASLGRMDVMCASLGWAGIASYICVRERNLRAALLASNALATASCLTHPCGALYVILLAAVIFYYDRGRLGWQHVALTAATYLIGLSAWGVYILKDPAQFWNQFGGNISGIASEFTEVTRWSGLASPFKGFYGEIKRYMDAFGWYAAKSFWMRLEVSIPLVYALGIFTALFTPPIRRHAGHRVLLLAGFLFFLVMALFEGLKASPYAVHSLPIAAALLGVSSMYYLRRVVFAVLTVFVGLQLGYGIYGNLMPRDQWDYAAAVRFLENHAAPAAQIIGSAELAFDRGFDSPLVDDPRLGYYSGKRPDFIVANRIYYAWFGRSKTRYPEIHDHIRRTLNSNYRDVFHNACYTVYQRSNPTDP
jgi:4-amino-4-deoxy-L-arabinose transferase-like glycosyltransferase